MSQFDYAAADALLGEWFPDQLMHDDPEWWDEMCQTLLACGSREAAIRDVLHPPYLTY